jgi:hypothetical protein
MKTKVLLAVLALSYAPLVVAGNEAAYPKEKVAAFVVEKMDLTSLPSAFRPKKEKGKKTLADYGFTAQRMDENEAIIEAPGGVRRLAIKVLDQKSSGIYVCVAEPGERLRSFVETPCTYHVCGFERCRPVDPRRCSWPTLMCGLSTSLPIPGMNSANFATRDSYLNTSRTQSVVCVETIC